VIVADLLRKLRKLPPDAVIDIRYPNDDQNWEPHLVINGVELKLPKKRKVDADILASKIVR
jgi:hypothetical protein